MKMLRSLLSSISVAGPVAVFGQVNMKADIQTAAMGTEDNWMISVAAIMIAVGAILFFRVKKRRRN